MINNLFKHLLLTALVCSYAPLAMSAKPGSYFGVGAGYTKIESPDFTSPGSEYQISENQGGFGGRVFAGYNIYDTIGLEVGLSKYADSKYKETLPGTGSNALTYSMNTLDLVGKFYLPINEKLDFYGLVGISYVSSKISADIERDGFYSSSGSKTTENLMPRVGFGMNYACNNNWGTGLEYAYTQGDQNVNSAAHISSTKMLTFNLTYSV